MRAVFEKPSDTVRRLIYEADKANKRIAYIELTITEANDLTAELRCTLAPSVWRKAFKAPFYYALYDYGVRIGMMHGVELRIETP